MFKKTIFLSLILCALSFAQSSLTIATLKDFGGGVKRFVNGSQVSVQVLLVDASGQEYVISLQRGAIKNIFYFTTDASLIIIQSSASRQTIDPTIINSNMIFIINADGSINAFPPTTAEDNYLMQMAQDLSAQQNIPFSTSQANTPKTPVAKPSSPITNIAPRNSKDARPLPPVY
ncbi:hypothetical protein EBQ93_04000 [bacterium]|nr:hypothetical protein [bacterium]